LRGCHPCETGEEPVPLGPTAVGPTVGRL